jgi:hypothetical protein
MHAVCKKRKPHVVVRFEIRVSAVECWDGGVERLMCSVVVGFGFQVEPSALVLRASNSSPDCNKK